MKDKTRILIVEDNIIVAEDIKGRVEGLGYAVTDCVTRGEVALKSVEKTSPDLILMDIELKGEMNGIQASAILRTRGYETPVIFVTAFADEEIIERAKQTEPFGYIIKPFDDKDLRSTIEIALYKHQTQRRLKESEEWLKTTLSSIGDGVIATDMQGCITFMNPVAESLTGWSQADASGKPLNVVFNIISELTRTPCENPVNKVIETGQIIGLANHTLLITRDGRELPIKDSAAPIIVNGTDTLGIVLVFQDDSKTRAADKKLRDSEEKYRHLFKNMLNGFALHRIVLDDQGKPVDYYFIEVNEAFEQLTGLHGADITGKKITEILPGIKDDPADWIGQYGKVAITGQPIRFDNYSQPLDKYFSVVAFSSRKDEFATIFTDVTERNQTKQHIEHLNHVLRSIRDINQLIVRETDPQQLIEECCRLLLKNRGYSSALIVLTDNKNHPVSWATSGIASSSGSLGLMLENRRMPSCFSLPQSAAHAVLIDDRASSCLNCPIARPCALSQSLCSRLMYENNSFGYMVAALDNASLVDTEERHLFTEMSGDIAYALNFLQLETAHQSSEQKRISLEDQLIQAQKMESVGRLAGGVAHDYNNMLSIIMGYSELMLEKMAESDPLYEDLTEISKAAKRSTDITAQLLTFARKQTISPKVVDLNDSIESMLKMLRRLIGEDIDLAWLPGAEMWPVNIDPSQVDQILANLCVNARDAIKDVGRVTIQTKNIRLDKDYCADQLDCTPGEYVMITVNDNGRGIAPEILDNIFEPFFTTKATGEGTGLGLATVYGIVRQNNGFINVYSEPEKGTSFKIYLPRYRGQIANKIFNKKDNIPLSQGEVVLLVEDDPTILKLGERILKELGYVVFSSSSPGKALLLAREHAGDIDLLVTDVIMPEMNGRELSEQLKRLQPNLKVLFMSGYTADVIAHRGILDNGVCFIAKPFSKQNIAIKLREALTAEMSDFRQDV